MLDAKSIEKEAKLYVDSKPDIKKQLEKLKQNENLDELFSYFIEKVKENSYLKVSYILNYLFVDAISRANFGNGQDTEGNTAYHYAALYGADEIIIILNDKRKFHGAQNFFRYNQENNEEKTPLDIASLKGKLSTFNLIWQRANKPQHDPVRSLRSACEGQNVEIIIKILQHPKCNIERKEVKKIYGDGFEGKFNDEVKSLLIDKFHNKNVTSETKRHAFFSEAEQSDKINKTQSAEKAASKVLK